MANTRIGRILVGGGGLAGMTVATALARQRFAIDLIEVQPQWQVLGVGISVQGPTLRALRSLGLLERCVEAGYGYTQVVDCDRNGKVFGVVDLPQLNGPDQPSCVGMMRPALHDVLHAAMTAAGIKPRLGLSVRSLREAADGIDVVFTDGSSSRYDLVIGADGAHSQLRDLLFGAHSPSYTGQAVWRAMVPRPPSVTARTAYYGSKHKSGFNPVSRDEAYVYLVQNVEGDPWLEPERWPAVMRELLADFGGAMAEARARITDPARIVYRPVECLLLPKPWHRGRIVLIGDAVHTAPPQLASGAAIAIEDAIVLAEMLASDTRPLDDMLRAFADRRYERCRLVVENSYQLGEWEKNPEMPGADPVRLQAESFAALAKPI